MSVSIFPLFPSPVSAARRRHRLTRTEAARRLGISTGHLRIVEAQTRRIAPAVIANIVAALGSAEPGQLAFAFPLFEWAAGESKRTVGGERGRS